MGCEPESLVLMGNANFVSDAVSASACAVTPSFPVNSNPGTPGAGSAPQHHASQWSVWISGSWAARGGGGGGGGGGSGWIYRTRSFTAA